MNIAIWGLGVSGKSTLKYLSSQSDNTLYVIDAGPKEIWYQEIKEYISIDKCFHQSEIPQGIVLDRIILSPGIDPEIKELLPYKGTEKNCEIELAFESCDLPIIGITGTNGKTTTATLMSMAFEKAGKSVFLGGNIGVPFCEIFNSKKKFDLVVLELSSFQLELLNKFRARIAIILNITESHMERYSKFIDYENAKLNIVNNQDHNDFFIAPKKYLEKETLANKILLEKTEQFDFSKSRLVGDHYKYNFSVILESLRAFDIPKPENIIQELINTFEGVKFRLQFVGEKNEILFYNDAKSTNSAATLSALDAFKNDKVTLILGGKLRDEIPKLKSVFSGLKNIKRIMAFGEAGSIIVDQLKDEYDICLCSNLSDVMEKIDKSIDRLVLFSPAFPSFDLYRNYVERGEDFSEKVNLL